MPFPGEFFRQWVTEFYQENRLARGTLRLGDTAVDVRSITCPLLVVGAREDNIAPPPSVKALMDNTLGAVPGCRCRPREPRHAPSMEEIPR